MDQARYHYHYVPVEWGFRFGGRYMDSHREVIDAYAAAGWRFAGVVRTGIVGEGVPETADLVFEWSLADGLVPPTLPVVSVG